MVPRGQGDGIRAGLRARRIHGSAEERLDEPHDLEIAGLRAAPSLPEPAGAGYVRSWLDEAPDR